MCWISNCVQKPVGQCTAKKAATNKPRLVYLSDKYGSVLPGTFVTLIEVNRAKAPAKHKTPVRTRPLKKWCVLFCNVLCLLMYLINKIILLWYDVLHTCRIWYVHISYCYVLNMRYYIPWYHMYIIHVILLIISVVESYSLEIFHSHVSVCNRWDHWPWSPEGWWWWWGDRRGCGRHRLPQWSGVCYSVIIFTSRYQEYHYRHIEMLRDDLLELEGFGAYARSHCLWVDFITNQTFSCYTLIGFQRVISMGSREQIRSFLYQKIYNKYCSL